MSNVTRLLAREWQIINVARPTDMFRGRFITPLSGAFVRYLPAILCGESALFYWLFGLVALASIVGTTIEASHITNDVAIWNIDNIDNNNNNNNNESDCLDGIIMHMQSVPQSVLLSGNYNDTLLDMSTTKEDGYGSSLFGMQLLDCGLQAELAQLAELGELGMECPTMEESDSLISKYLRDGAPTVMELRGRLFNVVKLMQMGLIYHLKSSNNIGTIFSLGLFLQPGIKMAVAGPGACLACISAACGACGAAAAFANLYCFAWGPLAPWCFGATIMGACGAPLITCGIICIAPTP